jgi:hypothetical protein
MTNGERVKVIAWWGREGNISAAFVDFWHVVRSLAYALRLHLQISLKRRFSEQE